MTNKYLTFTLICLLAFSVGYNISLWMRLQTYSELNYWISGAEYQSIKQEIQRLEKESKSINP